MKILLVVDNAVMRPSISKRIVDRLPGVRTILECSDGGSAVELYETMRPDWVLMDIKLEKTDGLTATGKITGTFPGAQIIILTNHDDEALREEASRVGARGYVLQEDLDEIAGIMEDHRRIEDGR